MTKKTIVARVEVKNGREEDFIEAAGPLILGTRAEEGNISYNLYRHADHPSSFIFYEEYRDEQAMADHAASAHFKAFEQAIAGMLAEEMKIEKY